ncbi:MAG: hypothetical protein G8345_16445 [Magnetococcales bacterium]|nr:hypothetical protein [Magnetococcales bacterium]NGZ28466.1 hypothetical protein [Magnetococcales bacterium]
MKKSLWLGVAAMAAAQMMSGTAVAGEVKIGGYYYFRVINSDNNIVTEDDNGGRAGADHLDGWAHRLQLNVDMKASEKSHAHMRVRVIDENAVTGADTGSRNGVLSEDTNALADWDIRELWLETEAWGVGVKVGEMPLSLHDDILLNHSTGAFGAISLSKSFGDYTVVGTAVKVNEENIGGGGALATGLSANDATDPGVQGANKDDVDLYVLSLMGKMASVDFVASFAYMNAQSNSDYANSISTNAEDSVSDWWLALTLEGKVADIKLTGTLIYEAGMDNVPSYNGTMANMPRGQAEGSDFLVALRAKAKTGFGGWNAYGFYAGPEFTNISNRTPEWSETWDASGPQANDLMNLVFDRGTRVSNRTAGNSPAPLTRNANLGLSSPTENLYGIGAGLTVKAGDWTIRPMLDYGHVAETDLDGNGTDDLMVKSAWGGSLIISTPIEKDTVLSFTAQYVDPEFTSKGNSPMLGAGAGGHCAAAATGPCEDSLHQLMADIKFTF